MNTKSFLKYLFILFAFVALLACEKKDEWSPGPQVSPDNPGVFFMSDIPTNIPVGVEKNGNLKVDHIKITLGRDEFKATNEIVVPIKVRYSADNLRASETVKFEAGKTTAEYIINIDQPKAGENLFPISLEIDENYANPYKAYGDGEIGGSTRIDLSINMISLLGVATFKIGDYSQSKHPEFLPWEQEIYDNHDGTYTIPNFLLNNQEPELDLHFRVESGTNYIKPLNPFWHVAGSGSAARWYFYTGEDDTSEFRVECFLPPAPGHDDLIRYIYFYTDPGYSNFSFYMDVENKKGEMLGYARYKTASSGRCTISFSWD